MNPLPDPYTFTILIYIDRSLHRPVISLSAMKNGDITIIDRMLFCLSNKIGDFFKVLQMRSENSSTDGTVYSKETAVSVTYGA